MVKILHENYLTFILNYLTHSISFNLNNYLYSIFLGKFNFENLYIQFLDQFQASSYSDHTFSRLVMAPLAQKHNIKWRQMIWSEHIHVLRFVTCTEDEVSIQKKLSVFDFIAEIIEENQ